MGEPTLQPGCLKSPEKPSKMASLKRQASGNNSACPKRYAQREWAAEATGARLKGRPCSKTPCSTTCSPRDLGVLGALLMQSGKNSVTRNESTRWTSRQAACAAGSTRTGGPTLPRAPTTSQAPPQAEAGGSTAVPSWPSTRLPAVTHLGFLTGSHLCSFDEYLLSIF